MGDNESCHGLRASKERIAHSRCCVWRVDDHEEFVLRADAWADPAAWGLLLVDVARHAAKAYETQGRDPTEALARIREGFDAEWTWPTDEAAPTKMR